MVDANKPDVDVLIAGAGVAGLLLAFELTKLGYSCLVVEKEGIAARQSGHSHGYLHAGYIYLRGNRRLVSQLNDAREKWKSYLQEIGGIQAITQHSIIGFENSTSANSALQAWRYSDLDVNEIERASFPVELFASEAVSRAFKTDEPSYDFPEFLSNLANNLPINSIVKAELRSFKLCGNAISSVEIECDGAIRSITPRFLVLCAGEGNGEIIDASLGKHRSISKIRTSYMMIIEGERLSDLSLIMPENQFYGHFMVSRPGSGNTRWLLSNYLSVGGAVGLNERASRLWSTSMLRVVTKLFPRLPLEKLRFGVYPAPKAEYRRDPEYLPDGKVIENFGIENLSAVWPTKLTLSPLIVNDVADQIQRTLNQPSKSELSFNGPVLKALDETWKRTALNEFADFRKYCNNDLELS